MKSMQAAARGAQEALGLEGPSHMKGLQVFIADIRNCQTKDQEQRRVEKELAKIRQNFTNTKNISGYDKKKYVWKLLYAYMLGYEVDFGHFQAVELCSSSKFSEKTAGYLAISLLLADNNDILRLVVNSLKSDMNSNEHAAALALNTVANIGGSEFADNLFADISKILLHPANHRSAYIKRKACICLLRLYRRDADSLQPSLWRQKLAALFHDQDVGLLTSASGLMLAILEQGAYQIEEWAEVIPSVAQCLHNMVQNKCPKDYEYYSVAAPWLQTKLLRILQFFPIRMFTHETVHGVNSVLHNILTKPAAQRPLPSMGAGSKKCRKADAERQNRSNAEHAILFEAMNLMIHLEEACDADSTRTAAGLLGAFVSSPDPNIRYLGLETMARLATNVGTHEQLDRYRNLIFEKMHETDISIRRQALNLLYALCRPENWQQIVDELLQILGASDALLQEELVLKIAILAEKNAPDFGRYVDVVFKILESAPESVGDDVWYRVVQVVTGFDDGDDRGAQERDRLQRHAAGKSFQALSGSSRALHDTLVKLSAYLIGEFGHLLPDQIHPRAKFEALCKHYSRGSTQAKSVIVLAVAKLLNATRELGQTIKPFLEDMQEDQNVELQQRACELMHLIRDEDMLDHVLFPMPQYADSVQQNNPLIQRLKFQTKSRAHTRAQLEEAAKSEGGVYKQGVSGRINNGSATNMMHANGSEHNLRSPAQGQRRVTGDNGSDSESGSESSEEGDRAGAAGAANDVGLGARELWQQLCITPQGRFFSSPSLILDLHHEYQAFTGRLTITFTNPLRAPIGNIQVYVPEVPHLRVQEFRAVPKVLGPGQTAQHLLQVHCMAPFLQPAKYQVEYNDGQQQRQLPLMLPAVMTKFVTPAAIQVDQFHQFFESFAGPPREGVVIAQAKTPPQQWGNYLSKGFGMHVIQDGPSGTLASGTLQTGTPDPQKPGQTMTVPVMVRLDYDAGRQMARLSVRTQHEQVTAALQQVLQTYLLVPPQQQGGGGKGGGYP